MSPGFDRGRLILALLLGVPSLLLFLLSVFRPVLPLEGTDPLLSALCHRQPDRCLSLPWGSSALCSRCTAFWLGLAAGSAVTYSGRFRPVFWTGLTLMLPLIADGLLQLHTYYESSNPLRVVTGLAAGLGISIVILGKQSRR
ncbi:MAG: hypothetical protein AVO35_00650 [Candidatus Aegiribacteria sp. MLS_C]|nr:MAG: hypothetical protein AVO35_00650 [Candidatus Aegiribacteria sp. MLS_C]